MKTLRALLWFCLLLPLIFAAVILVILAEVMSKRAPVAEVECQAEDEAELDEFTQEEIEVSCQQGSPK